MPACHLTDKLHNPSGTAHEQRNLRRPSDVPARAMCESIPIRLKELNFVVFDLDDMRPLGIFQQAVYIVSLYLSERSDV